MRFKNNLRYLAVFTIVIPAIFTFAGPLPAKANSTSQGEPLYTYDLTPIDKYDLQSSAGRNNAWAEAHFVAAMQGIVNRRSPRLYVIYTGDDANKPGGIDKFWLEKMRSLGEWLERRPLQPIPSPEGIVAQKLPSREGLVSGSVAPYLVVGSDMPNPDQIDEAVRRIQAQIASDAGNGPHFHIFRTILCHLRSTRGYLSASKHCQMW